MFYGTADALDKRRSSPMGDHGMIVGVVSWILLVAMIFTLLTRLAMKFAILQRGHRFGMDDIFIVLAALFSIGQTAAVSMEAMHALGQHTLEISNRQLRIFQKAEYAGCLLYIANMGCARISVCLLIKKILPGNCAKRICLAFAIFSSLWTISGILVTAFPCNLPQPWDFFGKKCINIINFINYIGITNIIVEVLLVIIPLVVWNLRLSTGRSISVSCVFLSRLSVVAAVSAQLAFFNRHTYFLDFTYDHWRTVLCVQVAQNLSIITACAPCLHPFILSILSGTTKTESLRFESRTCRQLNQIFEGWFGNRKNSNFDTTSSQCSTTPINEEKSDYCRPLATYGLDRSSAHLNSQHFNRFPSNVATPIVGPNPPENVFMRSVEIPVYSRPGTSHSKELPPIPKTLGQVGILPIVDWETDSSDHESTGQSGRSSAGSRRPNSEYVFNREKVISVPEENSYIYEQDAWKRYPPPPVSGEK